LVMPANAETEQTLSYRVRVDGRSVVKNWGAIWRIMALKLLRAVASSP
jgi:hypothetical protein